MRLLITIVPTASPRQTKHLTDTVCLFFFPCGGGRGGRDDARVLVFLRVSIGMRHTEGQRLIFLWEKLADMIGVLYRVLICCLRGDHEYRRPVCVTELCFESIHMHDRCNNHSKFVFGGS